MYVFELPFQRIKALSEILDTGNSWEILAAAMPGIVTEDVSACRTAPMRHMSPSEELLRIWGTKGYTVLHLYKVLAHVKHARAMAVIRDLVEAKYHKLEARIVSDASSAMVASVPSCSTQQKLSASGQPSDPSSLSARRTSLSSTKPTAACSLVMTSVSSARSENSNAILSSLQNTPAVCYDQLMEATKGFKTDNVIGRGGYGVVYKGTWKHTQVAVKRIQAKHDTTTEQERERLRQSLMELRTLALYRHDNILPLYGYSLDGPAPCLIYQYMAGGSLEDRILVRRNTVPLSWEQRLHIAMGTSKGLHFLHTIGAQPLIHGDVKSANILLDKYAEPKLGDFGLCRVGQIEMGPDATPIIASHIKGTLAYLPPEFVTSKHLSTKLDVFSFGVVMLEMATGLRAYSDARQPHSLVDFLTTAREIDQSRDMLDLADAKPGHVIADVFHRLLHVGLTCSHHDPNTRPTCGDIVARLDSIEN